MGGGVALFVHNSLNCKNDAMLARAMISFQLSLLTLLQKKQNCIVSGTYRAPQSDGKLFKNKYKSLIKMDLISEKQFFPIGDININSFDYESSIIVKSLFNCLFLRLKIYFPTAIGKHCILNVIQMFIMNS